MHELALTQSVIDLVTERARQEHLRSVTRVVLEIGEVVAVDAEALRFCFDAVAERTPAEGAELVIVPVALKARCRSCGCEYSPPSVVAPCTDCRSSEREWLAGREARVRSFDGE